MREIFHCLEDERYEIPAELAYFKRTVSMYFKIIIVVFTLLVTRRKSSIHYLSAYFNETAFWPRYNLKNSLVL